MDSRRTNKRGRSSPVTSPNAARSSRSKTRKTTTSTASGFNAVGGTPLPPDATAAICPTCSASSSNGQFVCSCPPGLLLGASPSPQPATVVSSQDSTSSASPSSVPTSSPTRQGRPPSSKPPSRSRPRTSRCSLCGLTTHSKNQCPNNPNPRLFKNSMPVAGKPKPAPARAPSSSLAPLRVSARAPAAPSPAAPVLAAAAAPPAPAPAPAVAPAAVPAPAPAPAPAAAPPIHPAPAEAKFAPGIARVLLAAPPLPPLRPIISLEEALKTRKRVRKAVPFLSRKALIAACRPAFNLFLEARDEEDSAAMDRAIRAFLMIPQLTLQSRHGGKKKRIVRDIDSQIACGNATIHRILSGERPDVAAPALVRDGDDLLPEEERDRRRRIRAAIGRARDGDLSGAMDSLTHEPLHEVNADIIERLEALHPPSRGPLPAPPPPIPGLAVNRNIVVDTEDLIKVLQGQATRKASGGLSGWTASTLHVLSEDSTCAMGITAMVQDMVNDKLRGESRDLLLASILLPLKKRGGSGVRPIALGEAIVRLAAGYVMYLLRDEVVKCFPNIQMGVGVAGGAEAAALALQTSLSFVEDAVLVSADIQNAFNTIPRHHVAAALHSKPDTAPAWSFFNFLYSSSTSLMVYDSDDKLVKELKSQEGVRQGCSVSAFAFSLTMQPLYSAVLENRPNVFGAACLDDFNFTGSLHDTLEALGDFERRCLAIGLHLNLSKTLVLWPWKGREPPDDPLPAGVQFTIGTAIVLGAPVGFDTAKTEEILQLHVESQAKLHKLLQHELMPSQIAIHLLRSCVMARSNYLVRVADPIASMPFCKALDAQCVATYSAKLVLPSRFTSEALQIFHLPAREGGIGVRSFEHVAPISHLAALAMSARHVSSFRQRYLSTRDADATPAAASIDALLSRVAALGVPVAVIGADSVSVGSVPADVQAFWDRFSISGAAHVRLTHLWTLAMHKSHVDRILNQPLPAAEQDVDAPPMVVDAAALLRLRAALRSSSGSAASAWLGVLPTEQAFVMSGAQFSAAHTLRMLLPRKNMKQCSCGVFSDDVLHFMSCQKERKRSQNARHDLAKAAVKIVCGAGDAVVELESLISPEVPRDLVSAPECAEDHAAECASGQRRRADLRVTMGPHTFLIDVSVTHPLCSSYIKDAADTRGSAAAKRQAYKHNVYGAEVKAAGQEFVGFAMESFGTLSEDADKFLRRVAAWYSNDNPRMYASFMRWARGVLSVALQRGNARVMGLGR